MNKTSDAIRAAEITFLGHRVDIDMIAGWKISFDTDNLPERLSKEELLRLRISDDGKTLELPERNIQWNVEDVFARAVGVSVLRSLVARLNGRVKSEKRAAASRANGLLGGDPKKASAKIP